MPRCLLAFVTIVLFLGGSQVARASCVGTPLQGLDPTGVIDNTAAIQGAIDAASFNGGGAVILNPGRYRAAGSLRVRRGVVLCGATHGPFEVGTLDPALTTVAATLLITNTSTPFITLEGGGGAVTDLLFHYPNQVPPSATAPSVYPFTITVAPGAPGSKIERCTVTNAYQFLDIESGRVTARDLYIGAFFIGIYIDHAADHVTLSDIIHSVFWDTSEYPAPIDSWVLNNGYAFVFLRIDSVQVHNVLIFHRFAAFYLADSPDPAQFPKMGYGSASNIDIDTCRVGIIARSSNSPGYKFTNIDIGCGTSTQPAISGVAQEAGGTSPPIVQINGGSIRGVWARGPFGTFTAPAKLVVSHVLGYNE